jgi:hypothetical protein
MPNEFAEGQKLKRLVKVYGVPGLVEVTLSSEGLSFRTPGSRKYVSTTWLKAVAHASPEADTPAWLANDPVKMLMHEEAKVGKRRAKRLDRENAE